MPIDLENENGPNGVPEKLAIFKFWFDRCSSKLGCDESRDTHFIPTRLLKISDDKWHLVYAPEDPRPGGIKYGTISHRWTATTKRSMLEHNTLTEFRSKHPLSDLPVDFKKAILIARFLGIKFLWIDSLCIIQDSEEDWARESMLMHDVYRNSICNIVIEPSADSSALDKFKQASMKEVE